ncbi:MAG: peptidyl-prolyl cis-trans isomerase, partial [Thermodesulfobacteriota bacterium]
PQGVDAGAPDMEKAAESDSEEKQPKMSSSDRKRIMKTLYDQKLNAREKEYFGYLTGKADIIFDEDVLSKLSGNDDILDKPAARFDGKVVFARELSSGLRKSVDMGEVKEAVKRIVLFKMLDNEAMSRGYEDEPRMAEAIKKYRDGKLVDDFKRKAVSALVTINDDDLSDYYSKYPEKFKRPDMLNLKIIKVKTEKEGAEIISELKAGSNFSNIAKEESLDPSAADGGRLGWVPSSQLGGDVLGSLMAAKEGEILGPFRADKDGKAYLVLEFLGMKKGEAVSFDAAKENIRKQLGTEKYGELKAMYIKRLKENIKVEINEDELKKVEEY